MRELDWIRAVRLGVLWAFIVPLIAVFVSIKCEISLPLIPAPLGVVVAPFMMLIGGAAGFLWGLLFETCYDYTCHILTLITRFWQSPE